MPVAPNSTRAMPSACPADALFLALDQGGHSSRALVFSAAGALVAGAQMPVATHSPQPDWVEQDAGELVASLRSAIAQVYRALGARAQRLCAAGLATQRSNVICWDRSRGTPLSPVLSWQDRRARLWLEQLTCDVPWLHARTGLYRSPHYGASKLRWCIDHLPAVQRAAAERRLCCGPLASYLLATLVKEHPSCIDPANAARTLLWNIHERDWDAELLKLFGIDRCHLPSTVPTLHTYGSLAWGAGYVPLRILTGDQSAALYADGRPRPDTLYINLGTGAFLQRPVSDMAPTANGLLLSIVHSDATHAEYVLEATVHGAGAAFDWAREHLGIQNIEAALAGWLQRRGEIPLFLNGIAGLGSPWWRADFVSRFIGDAEPWAQAVAVAESIVFLIMENLRSMHSAAPLQRIQLSGGLACLAGLCQRLADLSGLTVLRSLQPEASARGVAWLLAAADGLGWNDSGGAAFLPQVNTECAARYQRWRAEMYAAVSA